MQTGGSAAIIEPSGQVGKGVSKVADSNITKRALATSLRELMEQMPFEKISVCDICQKCGMNRKSFYYHFRDKYDLVNWIFDVSFFEIVGRNSGDNAWAFLIDLSSHLYENRAFYRKALRIQGQNAFLDHFREMLEPVIENYLKTILPEQEYLDFHVRFFADAFTGAFVRWLPQRQCDSPELFLTKLSSCLNLVAQYYPQQEERNRQILAQGPDRSCPSC